MRQSFGMRARALLREPLAHFLLIGLALFLLYAWIAPGSPESRQIVVTQARVDTLVSQFQSAQNRPPTPAELQGLIETWVRDEIIFREGLSMGLAEDDDVVKRRVRQKYELIAEENDRATPSDADLAAYLKAHPEEFARPAVVSFDQVWFDPSVAGPQDVAAAKSALERGADPASVGQETILPARVDRSSLDLVSRDFGDAFAKRVAAAPVDSWIGPVASGVGVHLVRVDARDAPRLPPLAQIRTEVAREWENDQRIRARDADYRKLRSGYDVVVKAKLAASPSQ